MGEPPHDVLQERELKITCLQPLLGVSSSGPSVVLSDAGFTIKAEVVDSSRDQQPTRWQWVCTAASGVPCFSGDDVPDTNSNELRIESGGMMLPGDYAFKVQME